jgi:hypothetical protein
MPQSQIPTAPLLIQVPIRPVKRQRFAISFEQIQSIRGIVDIVEPLTEHWH